MVFYPLKEKGETIQNAIIHSIHSFIHDYRERERDEKHV